MYNRGFQNPNGMMYQNAKSPARGNANMYANPNRNNNFQYLSPQTRQGGTQAQKQMMYSPQPNYTQRDRLKENQPPVQRQDLMYSPSQNTGYGTRAQYNKQQGAQTQNSQFRSPQGNQNGVANSRNVAPNAETNGNNQVYNPYQKYQQLMKSPGNSNTNLNYYGAKNQYNNTNSNSTQVMNVRSQGRPQGGFGLNRRNGNNYNGQGQMNEQYMMQSPKQNQVMYSPSQNQMKSPGYMGYQMYQSPSQRDERMRSPYENNNQRFCSPPQMNRNPSNSNAQFPNGQNPQQMYSPSASNQYQQQYNVQSQSKMGDSKKNFNYYSPQMNNSKMQNYQAYPSAKEQKSQDNYILTIDKPTIHPAKSREFLATKGKIDEMLQTAIQRSKELTKQIEETKAKVKNKEQEIVKNQEPPKAPENKNGDAKEDDSVPIIPYKKYNGEMVDKKRHGKGTCVYHTGEIYEGEWKSDRRHGFGSLKTADDKQIYFGDWEGDVFHGKGVFYNINAKICDEEVDIKNIGKLMRYLVSYDGEFSSGKFEGKGNIAFSNGDKFKGIFSQGIAHGDGLFITSKGMETKGKWINNKFVQQ